jgi:hypothetical protein
LKTGNHDPISQQPDVRQKNATDRPFTIGLYLDILHVQPIDEYAEHFVRRIIQFRTLAFPFYRFVTECCIEKGGVIAYEVLVDSEALRLSFWGSNMDLDDGLWVSWETSAVKQIVRGRLTANWAEFSLQRQGLAYFL